MNRENKRRKYDKRYFKTHPCMDAFTCRACGRLVVPEGAGSGHRNHCPYCLTSVHLDDRPGDRGSDCHGRMEPIGVWVRKKRRVGHHPPLRDLRENELQPHSGRR